MRLGTERTVARRTLGILVLAVALLTLVVQLPGDKSTQLDAAFGDVGDCVDMGQNKKPECIINFTDRHCRLPSTNNCTTNAVNGCETSTSLPCGMSCTHWKVEDTRKVGDCNENESGACKQCKEDTMMCTNLWLICARGTPYSNGNCTGPPCNDPCKIIKMFPVTNGTADCIE
jgi:hypothetical protein